MKIKMNTKTKEKEIINITVTEINLENMYYHLKKNGVFYVTESMLNDFRKKYISIPIHGFSENSMYDAINSSFKRSQRYNEWRQKMLTYMNNQKVPTYKDLKVNPWKDMKIEMLFITTKTRKYDTDNLVKTLLDIWTEYNAQSLNIQLDDSMFTEQIKYNARTVSSEEYGGIIFKITNIIPDEEEIDFSIKKSSYPIFKEAENWDDFWNA